MAGCRTCWVKTSGDWTDLEFCADCEHMGPHDLTPEQEAMGDAEDAYECGLMTWEQFKGVCDWFDDWLHHE